MPEKEDKKFKDLVVQEKPRKGPTSSASILSLIMLPSKTRRLIDIIVTLKLC